MAQISMTVRMDAEQKAQFDRLCEEFGMSANTAINVFVKAVIRSQSIPFHIGTDYKDDVIANGIKAIKAIRERAATQPEITLDEINAEIDAVRNGEKK